MPKNLPKSCINPTYIARTGEFMRGHHGSQMDVTIIIHETEQVLITYCYGLFISHACIIAIGIRTKAYVQYDFV